MLSRFPITNLSTTSFNYMSEERHRNTLESMGLTPDEIDEFLELLPDLEIDNTLASYVHTVFEPKEQFKHQTRFSDGSFPVFYSALEPETAQVEVLYHRARQAVDGKSTKCTLYYMRLSCKFSGNHIDLRPHLYDFPFLTQNGINSVAYESCNHIGKQAVHLGLAALLTPSARHNNGSCLPIFSEAALSDFRNEGVETFVYDPITSTFSPV